MLTTHNIDIQAMLVWLTLPLKKLGLRLRLQPLEILRLRLQG